MQVPGGQSAPRHTRMKLAPHTFNSNSAVPNNLNNSNSDNQHAPISFHKSQMMRIYSTELPQETIWMRKERLKENDPDANSPRSCDNTINTGTESKYDDDELEAALEAFAWFKGEQRATTEANRLRLELSNALTEIEKLKKYAETVTTDMSQLQIEIQRSDDRHRATSPMEPSPTVCTDEMEDMSRSHAHEEAMWLSERKQLKDEMEQLKEKLERALVEGEKPFKEELYLLREKVAALREEKELLQNREDAIVFQAKRDSSGEIDQLRKELHSAQQLAQSSNVDTVDELNRLQNNHDIVLAELENLKEDLKLAEEEASWLRADKVIAEEGAKVKAKISAAAEASRQKELNELKELNSRLVEELDEAVAELEANKCGPKLKKVTESSLSEDRGSDENSVNSSSTSSNAPESSDDQKPVISAPSFTALYNLSVLLQSKGKLSEAVPHCKEALSCMRSALGDEHPDTLQCMNTMATIYYEMGEYDLAEPLSFECYYGMKSLLGPSHESTLTAVVNLAVLLQALKRLEEAEPLFQEFFERREGILPDTHRDSLRAMNNLSLLLQSQGKCAEAEPYCRRSLECMRTTLGELHPDTLQSISNLAMLLYGQGKLEDAEPYCYEALSGMRTALGNSHMSTLASVSNLAMMLQGQKKFESAEPYCREALAGMRNTLGNTHSITLASISNLAMLLYNRHQFEEAETLYREAFETMRDSVGADDRSTLGAMSNLAMLQQSRGKPDDAALLFRECLNRRRNTLGDTHPDTIRSLNSLACLLQSQGKIDEAEEIYRESFALVKKRAEDTAAEEVERYKEQMSESSQSGKSDSCSGKSDDVYANYNEESLILKGTLSSSTLNSMDDEGNNDNSSRRALDSSSVGESAQSMLSSTSSTARVLMLHSQSPKLPTRKSAPPVQLIKCTHDKCRLKFTSLDRYVAHLQVQHQDSKEEIAERLLMNEKKPRVENAPNNDINDNISPDENVYFGCNYENCHQLFKNMVDRNIHVREVHLGGDYCNTSISSISSNSTGTGTSPIPSGKYVDNKSSSIHHTAVVCPDKSCKKSFKSAKDRNNHMKDAHGLVMRSGVVSPPPGLALFSPPGLGTFLDEDNTYQTSAKSSKASHDAKNHTQIKNGIACPFVGCSKQCKSDSALLDHIKKSHTAQIQKQHRNTNVRSSQKPQRSPDGQKNNYTRSKTNR